MLKYIVVALIFWFNPLVSSIDILPDIFGYLLIIKAFSKASYSYSCASDLCTCAKKMCIITGVKFFSIFMVSSFDVTMSLLLSFSFGLVELIFGIPFIINLFDTVAYLAPLENTFAHGKACKMKRFTVTVFVTRLVLAVLPDLTALSLNDALTVDTDVTYIRFRPLFILFSVFISTIICTVWLVRAIKYFKRSVDASVNDRCMQDFTRKTSEHTSLLFAKRNLRALSVIIFASVFVFDFTWGYTSVDILQDFMLPLLTIGILCYLLVLRAYKIDKMFFVLLGAFALQLAADIFEMAANITYYEEYNIQAVLKVSHAEDLYFNVSLSAVFASVALVVSCVLVLIAIRRSARESILAHKGLFSELDISYYLKEFDRKTRKSIIISTAIVTLCAFMYALSVIVKPYAEGLVLLNTVFELLTVISIISFVLYIHDEVYKRILTFA